MVLGKLLRRLDASGCSFVLVGGLVPPLRSGARSCSSTERDEQRGLRGIQETARPARQQCTARDRAHRRGLR